MEVSSPISVIAEVSGDYYEVWDNVRNRPYFFREVPKGCSRIKFNIRDDGDYTVPNVVNIGRIKTPARLPELPTPDRNRVKNIHVVHDPALKGTPAQIFTKEGLIKVSNEFLTLPKPIQDFLYYHEYGHLFYLDEFNCDLFALVSCLRRGGNRSMCFYALSNILSSSKINKSRLEKMFNHIQETQVNKL